MANNQKEESTERQPRQERCSQEETAALREAKERVKDVRLRKEGIPMVDSEKTFRAVLAGNFRQLDPVTGDASCEMRVPFILDAMDILEMSCFKPESLIPGFIAMYGPQFSRYRIKESIVS
jgi:hypothetical protein